MPPTGASSLGSADVDNRPGAPDPSEEGEAHEGPAEGSGSEWTREEEGPFYSWLPPEDRLWRHPSESQPTRPAVEVAPPKPVPPRWPEWIRPLRSTWVIALVAALVGATAATGIGVAGGLWPRDTTILRSSQPSTTSITRSAVGGDPTDWTTIDDTAALSVVTLSVEAASGNQTGSGLVLQQSSDGYIYIVTDRGFFAGYYGSIRVTYATGLSAPAILIGTDALSGLAVLKAPNPGAGIVAPADTASVGGLRDGDPVLAVGSRVAPSVWPGLVSAQDRTVDLSNDSDMDGLLALSMTALTPIAAGGPVLDQFGQVVGVTLNLQPVSPSDQALTFAAPIDEVNRIASQIVDHTPVTHPWLGVTDAIDLPSSTAHQMGIVSGVLATSVSPSSPAAAAGIRPNDIITSLGGNTTPSTGTLVADVNGSTPGQVVPVTYVHDGHTVRTKLTIGREPADG
jgi:putative serine protease PepD